MEGTNSWNRTLGGRKESLLVGSSRARTGWDVPHWDEEDTGTEGQEGHRQWLPLPGSGAGGGKRLCSRVSKADQDRAGGDSGRCHLSYELGRAPSLTCCPAGSPGSAQA